MAWCFDGGIGLLVERAKKLREITLSVAVASWLNEQHQVPEEEVQSTQVLRGLQNQTVEKG